MPLAKMPLYTTVLCRGFPNCFPVLEHCFQFHYFLMICNIFWSKMATFSQPGYFFEITAIEQFLLKAAGSFRKIEAGFVAGGGCLFILGPTKIGLYNFIVF